MKTDKTKSLLDASIATSLLTGIVAQTDRFSNTHTTSRVMTTAAQLMAAGADQQLIAMKLEENHEIGESSTAPSTVTIEEPAPAKDSLSISHEPTETLEEMDKRVKAAEQAEAATAAGDALTAKTGEETKVADSYAPGPSDVAEEPSMGGTLNATTEQAAEDARHEKENDQNKTILSHSYLSTAPSYETPMSGSGSSGSGIGLLGHDDAPGQNSVNDMPPSTDELVHSAYSMDDNAASAPAQVAPIAPPPPPAPADLGLPMPPPLPDFSQTTPMSAYAPDIATPPERLGDILAPEPPSSPPAPSAPVSPSPAPGPTDPTQFKIPGQS
jgi:hypothetical protein